METRVLRFIRDNRLITGRQKVVVAVSGGADSACLLHLLYGFRKELDIELHVAHLNHQLRGADAEADACYVVGLAQRLDIPVTVERGEVRAYRVRHRLSLEEAAREVRYTFLTQVAGSVGADMVAVGHTADDHVETILMHLVRGTGTRGLLGLQPTTCLQPAGHGITVIRPLLATSRRETADYCQQHQLEPRLDASNLSLSPLRNRIRRQLLPRLRGYNPQVDRALLRTARIAADEQAFLDGATAARWSEVVREYDDTLVLEKEGLLRLPVALQRSLLRMAMSKLLGNLKDIELRHIEEMMAILSRPAGRRIKLPGGLTFSIEYGRYLLGKEPAALSPFPVLEGEISLPVPGETRLSGWRIVADIVEQEAVEERDNSLIACFDMDKTGSELILRSRRRGDRFQPLGMSALKKLGEFMIDARIPQAWRDRIPIVGSPRHILWVVGWRIDDRAKVTGRTRRVLRLQFKRR
ncbi:tRNA lysidine(34) synthetase TilS [Chloroflexota bacterium]